MSAKADAIRELYSDIPLDPAFDKIRSGKRVVNFVPGSGNLNASLVFIGEAPGYNENVQRKPFVGRAGSILDDLLKHAGIARERVFVTNVVKFKPPNNRTPWPSEIKSAQRYLNRELRIIGPRVVVLLGAAAVRAVWLPDPAPPIGQAHGTIVWRADPWHYAIMYHPMALGYGNMIQAGKDDMRALRDWCDMHGISI